MPAVRAAGGKALFFCFAFSHGGFGHLRVGKLWRDLLAFEYAAHIIFSDAKHQR